MSQRLCKLTELLRVVVQAQQRVAGAQSRHLYPQLLQQLWVQIWARTEQHVRTQCDIAFTVFTVWALQWEHHDSTFSNTKGKMKRSSGFCANRDVSHDGGASRLGI